MVVVGREGREGQAFALLPPAAVPRRSAWFSSTVYAHEAERQGESRCLRGPTTTRLIDTQGFRERCSYALMLRTSILLARTTRARLLCCVASSLAARRSSLQGEPARRPHHQPHQAQAHMAQRDTSAYIPFRLRTRRGVIGAVDSYVRTTSYRGIAVAASFHRYGSVIPIRSRAPRPCGA